jgi:hypothetical protein
VGRLTGIDTVLLLDLDGTLYVDSQVVPGPPETVRWLLAQGLTVRFTTNTDSIPPTALADRRAGPGQASHPRPGRRSQLRSHLRRPGRRVPGSAVRGATGHHPGQPDCGPRQRRAPGHRRLGKGDRPQPGAGAEPDAVVDSVADLPGLLQD